jgi:hypothetical protein
MFIEVLNNITAMLGDAQADLKKILEAVLYSVMGLGSLIIIIFISFN